MSYRAFGDRVGANGGVPLKFRSVERGDSALGEKEINQHIDFSSSPRCYKHIHFPPTEVPKHHQKQSWSRSSAARAGSEGEPGYVTTRSNPPPLHWYIRERAPDNSLLQYVIMPSMRLFREWLGSAHLEIGQKQASLGGVRGRSWTEAS